MFNDILEKKENFDGVLDKKNLSRLQKCRYKIVEIFLRG